MRSALFTALALVSATGLAQAQLLASDDFSIAGPITSNGWVAHSGAGNKLIMSDGNVVTLDQSSGSGEDVNLSFTPQLATDTTYAAFDLNVPSGNLVNPDANGLYCFHLKDSAFGYRARTGLLSPVGAGDFALAVNPSSSNLGAGASWPTDLSFDVTYRVVVSYDAAAGASQLWLDPVDQNSASVMSTGGTAGTLIEAVAMRQSNDYTGFITIDNVAVGMTFADVLGGGGAPNSGNGFCFGDGSGALCPCGNFGGAGEGCRNGSGTGAALTGTGNASVAGDTFVLDVVGVDGNRPGLMLRADNQVAIPVGDGLLCTSGNSERGQVQVTNAGATQYTNFNGSAFGAVGVGVVKNYQFWYRDSPAGSPCGANFNFSNGWTVTYIP